MQTIQIKNHTIKLQILDIIPVFAQPKSEILDLNFEEISETLTIIIRTQFFDFLVPAQAIHNYPGPLEPFQIAPSHTTQFRTIPSAQIIIE